jgi:hypothetical protein
MTADIPRFRLVDSEHAMLETAWRAWLDAITRGYFGAERTRVDYQAMTVEALATGLAWFALASAGRRPRGRRRIARLHGRGRYGPGHDVRDGSIEALANAVLDFAAQVRNEYLPEIDRTVAAHAVHTAAMAAAAAYFERHGYARGAAEALLVELRERAGSEGVTR